MVNKKLYLSPSNQTANKYAYGNTNEAAQCQRMAEATQTALTRCGFQVKNGGGASMAAKVAESNAWGADLHICIHTNAANGEATGTRIFCSGMDNEGGKAAKAVFTVLAPLTPGTAESVKVRTDLYEINNTSAYCVYVEVDFHDVRSVAQWLIEHTVEVGEVIAEGICNYYAVPYVAADALPTPDSGNKIYKSLDAVPAWAQPTVRKLVAAGILRGTGNGLDLTNDLLRMLVINDRSGLYG